MKSMKIINLLFILLFLVSAFLQLNDPDPEIWFSLYLSGAFICGFALFGEIQQTLLWLALAIYACYAIYLFFSPDGVWTWYYEYDAENIAQSMTAGKPHIEATREFFGLLILCGAAALNILFCHKTRSQPQTGA